MYVNFINRWLADPRSIGSPLPSGRDLSRKIALSVNYCPGTKCVEVGAGTGAVTIELLRRGVQPNDLELVEPDPHFAEILRIKFPQLTVIEMRIPSVRPSSLPRAQVVVSSLPFRSMKRAEIWRVVESLSGALCSSGSILQYSYFPGSPIPKEIAHRYDLVGKRIASSLINLPPASIWEYKREKA